MAHFEVFWVFKNLFESSLSVDHLSIKACNTFVKFLMRGRLKMTFIKNWEYQIKNNNFCMKHPPALDTPPSKILDII